MSDTVTVSVQLPKVEGYEYTGEYRAPKKGDFFAFFSVNLAPMAAKCFEDYPAEVICFILRPIQSKTVMVELTLTPVGKQAIDRVFSAIRRTSNTSPAEPEKCGIPYEEFKGETMAVLPVKHCTAMKGHEGAHCA